MALVIVGLVFPRLVLFVLALLCCHWSSWGWHCSLLGWIPLVWSSNHCGFLLLCCFMSLSFTTSFSPPYPPPSPSLAPSSPPPSHPHPFGKRRGSWDCTSLLRELRHYWGSPHPSIEGRGSWVSAWVWLAVICGGEGRGGGGRMREDARKSTMMGLMADYWWQIKTLLALIDNIGYDYLCAR